MNIGLKARSLVVCLTFAACFVSQHASAAPQDGRRVTARDLAALTDLDGLSVSPDGKWIAFQTRRADPRSNTYDQAWHVVPVSGGAPRRVADGGEPILFSNVEELSFNGYVIAPAPQWSPDGRWMIYLRRDNGRTQLWRSRVDGQGTEQLTRGESDVFHGRVIGNTGMAFSADGGRLFYAVRPTQAQFDSTFAAEARAGFHFDDRFTPYYGGSARPLAYSGGRLLTSLWVYDFPSRRERAATEAEAAEYAALTAAHSVPDGRDHVRGDAFASSNGALAWTEARDPAQQGMTPPLTIVAQPSGAAEPIVCAAAVCTSQFVSILGWHHHELLFQGYSPGGLYERILYAWHPGKGATPRAILSTKGLYKSPEWHCSIAQDRLVCFHEDLDRPRRLIAVRLNDGAVETLHEPNPDWSHFDLGPKPHVVPVRLSSGPEFHSYLALPPDYRAGQRLPLVIVTYVCAGFLRGGSGDEYPVFPFAAQGFAVLCHNIFLSDWAREARETSASPLEFVPGVPFRRRVQEGLDTVVAELDRMGIIDPNRVGITGLSAGAQTVGYALSNMPRLSAAIASSLPMEPAGYFLASPSVRRDRFRARYGIDSALSPRWNEFAVARNVDKVRAPLLINVADKEMLGPLEAVAALEDASRAVEMYVFPDEYHIKWQPAHRLTVYERNIDWMNFWLRGVESGLTGDASQYERWRSMRQKQCQLSGLEGTEHSRRPGGRESLSDDDPVPWYCRSGALEQHAH